MLGFSRADSINPDWSFAFTPFNSHLGALLLCSELCQHFSDPHGLFGKHRAYLVVVLRLLSYRKTEPLVRAFRLLGKLLGNPVEAPPCLHHSTNCALLFFSSTCAAAKQESQEQR